MVIQDEIAKAIKESANNNKKIDRNIEIILYYYGFGDIGWPTLQNIADKFEIGTRERVRQIINSMFRDRFSSSEFEFLGEIAAIIDNKDNSYIQSKKIAGKLGKGTFISIDSAWKCVPSLRGLLNMLHDMGLCLDYNLCHRDLSPISRKDIDTLNVDDTYIVNTKVITRLAKGVSRAKSLPNKTGLVSVENLKKEIDFTYAHSPLSKDEMAILLSIIKELSDSVFIPFEGDEYYLIEKRNNAVISNIKKSLFVSREVNSDRLAHVVSSALKERGAKYPYPSTELIELYIQNSSLLKVKGGVVTAIDKGDVPLSDIETAIVAKMKKLKEGSSYGVIKEHLLGLQYSEPHIVKSVSNSPLVFVDRTRGRGNYSYHLV